MKSKVGSLVLSLLMIASLTATCFGQKRGGAMTIEQIKASVSDACAKSKRLTFTLKSGATMSGTVAPHSDNSFSFRPGGRGNGTLTVDYSDVASIKGRNPFVKAFTDMSQAALTAVEFAAGMPLWMAIQVISLLSTGELYHDC